MKIDNYSDEDRSAENKRYYGLNKEQIKAQKRENRRLYMQEYRLIQKAAKLIKNSRKKNPPKNS